MEPAKNLKLVEDFQQSEDASPKSELASEQYKRADKVARVMPPNNMSREITSEAATKINKQLRETAEAQAKAHGLYVCYVLNDFESHNSLSQDVTIKFSAAHPLGHDRFAIDLIQGKGRKFKFKPEYYGKTFVRSGIEYIVMGIDVSDEERPFVMLRSPNGSVMAHCEQVHRYLKKNGLI